MAAPSSPTILVVDDHADNRYALTQLLRKRSYQVYEAGTGADAVRLAVEERPDLIILDINLPDFSGLEVCRRIKGDPATAGIAILQTSASLVHGRHRAEGLDSGADGYLAQPFEPAELLATVHALLRARKAEEALRGREEELRLLLEATPDVIVKFDRQVRFLYVSPAMERLTGLPPEHFLGRTLAETGMAADGCIAWEQTVGKVFETGRPQEMVFDLPSAASVRHFEVRLAPQLGAGGAIEAVVGVTRDVTEQRRTEEALREADRRKDEFLAMLGHELRNPLSPIRNAVTLLRLIGPTDPPFVQARDMIDRQVGHMTRLVDDLLDASRIARGKILLRKDRCDLNEIVAQTAEDYRGTLEGNGLRLEVRLPHRPLWMQGDCTRLAQMVGNVLHNAGKFTDTNGQVTLTLATEADDAAVISVRDTGIGVEPDVLARVFETFSQADHGLDRSRGGLGLGLSLVKGLAEMHGGTVRAYSEGQGKGMEVVIRLPLESALEAQSAPTGSGCAAGSALRILVVEDSQDSAQSLKMLLELVGHRVEIAFIGLAGLEAGRRFVPEVVLCDIGLPGGMNGYALAQALRQEPATATAFLIALTGYGQEEDKRRAQEAGFDLHLTKPLEFEQLQQVLASLIKERGAPR